MHQPKKAPENFNPFEDRLSRDIRNDLSESVIQVLSSRSLEPAEHVAQKYTAKHLAPIYRDYMKNRLNRYSDALAKLPITNHNILMNSGILWDLGLFFEVHEILEPEWMEATGDTRLLLQALIRAAGVYIYLELGYETRAAKIAAKTIPVLKQFRERLQQELLADALIKALEELSGQPPLLTKPG